jgi:hypothetical protein
MIYAALITPRQAQVIAGIAIAVVFAACSNSTGPGLTLSDKEYVTQGWQQFEAQHYDQAVSSFTSAYNAGSASSVQGEALCGRGWSSMYRRDLQKAKSDFSTALALAGLTPGVLNDLRVGNAFTLYSLNAFSDEATNSTAALTNNPSYVFTHDSKVTTKRVRLLLSQSYFANGQFVLAATQLDIVDPAQAPHSADPVLLLGTISAILNSL